MRLRKQQRPGKKRTGSAARTSSAGTASASKADVQYMMETVLAAIQDVEKRMATREELKGLATKEELRESERRVMGHIDLRFEQLRADFGVQRWWWLRSASRSVCRVRDKSPFEPL